VRQLGFWIYRSTAWGLIFASVYLLVTDGNWYKLYVWMDEYEEWRTGHWGLRERFLDLLLMWTLIFMGYFAGVVSSVRKRSHLPRFVRWFVPTEKLDRDDEGEPFTRWDKISAAVTAIFFSVAVTFDLGG